MSVKRNLIILCSVNFLVLLGFGAFNILRPYLVLALKGVLTELPEKVSSVNAGEAVIELGLMMSAFMASRSVMSVISGYLGDVFGRKRIILLGLTLYILVGLLYGICDSVSKLIILRLVQGIASGMVWPVAAALITESVNINFRGRAISIYSMTGNIARMIGPAFGVILYSFTINVLGFIDPINAFRAPAVIISLLSFPAFILSLMIIEPRIVCRRYKGSHVYNFKSFFSGFSDLTRDVKITLSIILLNGFTNGVAMGIFNSVATVFIIEYIVKDPSLLGSIMSLSALAGLLSTYPASWLSDKIGRKIIVVLAMIPARFSVMVVPFARDYFTLMLIFLVRAASFNVSMPVMRALQADIAPRSIRGRVFGLQEALSNLGFFFGPLIGSYLYYVLKGSVILGFPGIVIPFFISGVISFLTLILFAIFVREPISIAP
ncbi:MAG: hypothetical protein DRJ30_02615 [Candidatus Methanomethylicota archaeon]|nr:MAG: hypothetical protein DRJ30_02615 [Candidatus Verstraetearchaeota archaeon]